MDSTLAIGDFARATHLSVKTLRHYHRLGLLEPVEVDRFTGYRRYSADQIPTAQVIRRFRELDMPLGEIREVLGAADLETRNALIAGHLSHLEGDLDRTGRAVAALRDLLHGPSPSPPVERRSFQATPAAAITEILAISEASVWFQEALGELYATLTAQQLVADGPAGGLFSTELFAEEKGEATIYLPCSGGVRAMGRVEPNIIPGAELATIVHCGSHRNIDLTYGLLATYVTRHALAVEGPVRELYLVGRSESTDTEAWVTEIGWPIFATGMQPPA